jgi:hypothetical protein
VELRFNGSTQTIRPSLAFMNSQQLIARRGLSCLMQVIASTYQALKLAVQGMSKLLSPDTGLARRKIVKDKNTF